MQYTFKPARAGDALLILGAGVWGKGATFEEAKANCGWASVLRRNGYHVLSVHPDTYINDAGFTVYPREHEPLTLATYT